MTPAPAPPPRRTERACDEYDRAYAGLVKAIRADLADGSTVSAASLVTGWSREYIKQIRDGISGDTGPKRGNPRKRLGKSPAHNAASLAANSASSPDSSACLPTHAGHQLSPSGGLSGIGDRITDSE